jgi:DNA-binding NtrC family response regulator
LIVDDDALLSTAYMRILKRSGFTILCAASAAQALEIVEREDCTVVLCDVILPGLSGFDLAVRLQAKRPKLRVLLMSGHGNSARPRGPELADVTVLQKSELGEQELLAHIKGTAPTALPRA